jgi:hypothetical protein
MSPVTVATLVSVVTVVIVVILVVVVVVTAHDVFHTQKPKLFVLNGHQTKLENNDTVFYTYVSDTYNARGVQFTCKLVFLLRIVQVRLKLCGAQSAHLHFDCDLNAPLENILSKQGQQSEKTNQLHDCNSTLRTHLISCRVDYTCFATCAIPSKRGAIANALVFSRHQNVSGNIRARSV